MAKKILFLHDTTLATPRGAELTIKEVMALGETKDYSVQLDYLKDFDSTKKNISKADLVIINSTSRCHFELELLGYIISKPILYVKVEYDYNFCIRRNVLCTVDPKIRSCCHPDKFHLFRKLFAKAVFNVFQSPKHYQTHYEFYGEAISQHLIMPPTVDTDALQPSDEKDEKTIPFFGDLNYLKGGEAYLQYAHEHPEQLFVVYGKNHLRRSIPDNVSFHDPVSNKEVLKILGRSKKLFCKPVWPEPSGRLVAEAFLSGCEIEGNDRIGTFSFDFYPNNKEKAIAEMKQAPSNFWDKVEMILHFNYEEEPSTALGTVLVYKSYGGLGDIFFAVPAIYKLAKVTEELHFAVAPRLVDFFTKHLTGVKVVNEDDARNNEKEYDYIYELGNYPAFRGYDLPHALKYPTHKKLKQHAIGHYIDTVSKLHKSIDNQDEGYPYFRRELDSNNKYYVVHHGAGFLLKIWPTDNFATLIERLQELYPNLGCKIIMGPEDPEIGKLFKSSMPHVEYVTGGMLEVGDALSGALFHIGNDAGITHVAGSFNVPTVAVYGPTGPGSWGSFAEYNELIWGKKGVCNLRCNYDVILNCAHRVCLTSVTVDRVLESLYKVLQKAYKGAPASIQINPLAEIELGEKDCLIKLNDNDLFLEYHSPSMKRQLEQLISTQVVEEFGDIMMVVDVLKKQGIIFEVPSFENIEETL